MCVCWRPRVLDEVTDRKAFSLLNVPRALTLSRGRRLLFGASGPELLTKLPIANGHYVRLLRPRTISLTGNHRPIQLLIEWN